MKRCPTCNQNFEEDWLSFCTQDGTTLVNESATLSEPPPTIMAPRSAETPWSAPLPEIPPSASHWQPLKPDVPDWQATGSRTSRVK